MVEVALEHRAPHLAFTYNEPTIWGEYVIDIAREAHAAGLNTVMVSNGYITREAFFDIYRYIDAANIDLKAFTENFYGKITLTHLQPVLDTLKWLRHETGVWFEITNLIIPTLNDGDAEFKELCDWVLENLGDDVPLHFTAFHPDFKLQDKPPRRRRRCIARARSPADGPEVRVRRQHLLRRRQHDLSGMQAGGDHALVARGDVEPAEERLLRELRHAHRRRVHQGRGGEAAGVGERAGVDTWLKGASLSVRCRVLRLRHSDQRLEPARRACPERSRRGPVPSVRIAAMQTKSRFLHSALLRLE